MVHLESQKLPESPYRHRERMMLSQVHPHHSNRTVPHTTRKMTKRVSMVRQEDEDRRVRQETTNLVRIVVNESGKEEDTEDVEGTRDESEIWEVTHVTEEDFEINEGETEDLYDKLMEMVGWNVTERE